MKHMITLLFMLATAHYTHAQSDTTALKTHAAELDSIAQTQFNNEDYVSAADNYLQSFNILSQLYGEGDTTAIRALMMTGKCYYRSERKLKAVETAQRVVALYAQHQDTCAANYAFYLDNLALYQAANKQPEDALKNSLHALSIYEKLSLQDPDLSFILMHVAENLDDLNRPAEAIPYELRALNILRDEYGEHSKEYLDELPYLKRYYEQAHQDDRAEKLQQRYDKLKEEADQGIVDLPEPMEFTTTEQCREHKDDMMAYCQYYLNHYFKAPQMPQAAAYIMSWSMTSDDVHITFGEDESKLLADQKTLLYAVSYAAGCAVYALSTDSADFTYDMYEYAMIEMLNHYIANKELTGPVTYLEKYIKAHEKSREQLAALIRKSYDKLLRDQQKGKIKKAAAEK